MKQLVLYSSIALGVIAVGCESAEERCNAAKVAAHDAFEAWAVVADERWEHAEALRRECMSAPADSDCFARAGRADIAAGVGPRELRRIGDRATGGAVAFRDAVAGFRDDYNITADEPVEEAAFAAAAAHWEACQAVDP